MCKARNSRPKPWRCKANWFATTTLQKIMTAPQPYQNVWDVNGPCKITISGPWAAHAHLYCGVSSLLFFMFVFAIQSYGGSPHT